MNTVKNLFFVDDDELFTFITTKTIKETGFVGQVKTFGNGLEVFNFLKENRHNTEELPEIILLDINMPIMDGWQFLERYESLIPDVKKNIAIYVLSSSIFPEDIEKAKNFKTVSDYIIKPINKERLVELLGQVKQ